MEGALEKAIPKDHCQASAFCKAKQECFGVPSCLRPSAAPSVAALVAGDVDGCCCLGILSPLPSPLSGIWRGEGTEEP